MSSPNPSGNAASISELAEKWPSRVDGCGLEHRRWSNAVQDGHLHELSGSLPPRSIAIIGFNSDEGVRRNGGRTGAAAAPDKLRMALAPLSAPENLVVVDKGNIAVVGEELEAAQISLSGAISAAIGTGCVPIVLGGGHETAYGSFSGLRASELSSGRKVGILNLDAHFDLRDAPSPTSGTPFLQIYREELARGFDFSYAVVGISEANNTSVLFQTAKDLGVVYLRDVDCGVTSRTQVLEFVDAFVDSVDLIYLTIDLDVLPASEAPGVSAPAGLGVSLEVINSICEHVGSSQKLALVDVVELNPRFDIDNRTARTAARLIHTITSAINSTNLRHATASATPVKD